MYICGRFYGTGKIRKRLFCIGKYGFASLASNQVRSLASVALEMELSRKILLTKGVFCKESEHLSLVSPRDPKSSADHGQAAKCKESGDRRVSREN